jgi:hypothetical protein
MKLLLLPLLLVGAGLLTGGSAGRSANASDCRIEVECGDRGTCVVTCYDEQGNVRCRKEIACDRPCELPEDCRTR